MSRLSSLSPELAASLDGISPPKCLEVMQFACSEAAKMVHVDDPHVLLALSALAHGDALKEDVLRELRERCDAYDERYFALQESGAPQDVYLEMFAKARVVCGLVVAFEGNLHSNVDEVVYECTSVFEDPSSLIEGVMAIAGSA